LQIDNVNETVDISVLGHYQPSCAQNFQQLLDFIQPSITTKSSIYQIIDDAAKNLAVPLLCFKLSLLCDKD